MAGPYRYGLVNLNRVQFATPQDWLLHIRELR